MPTLTTTEAARLIVLQGYQTKATLGGTPLNESELNELKALMGKDISQLHVVDTRKGTAGSYLW